MTPRRKRRSSRLFAFLTTWWWAWLGILYFTTLPLWGWVDADDATRIIEDSGYTDIEIDSEFHWFGCHDILRVGFEATGHTGRRVSGMVCCGLIFKDCTVRLSQ